MKNEKTNFKTPIIGITSRLYYFKGIYPYGYINSWSKCYETSLQNKENFYSDLNVENIFDSDYNHAKNMGIGDCHGPYVQGDTLL